MAKKVIRNSVYESFKKFCPFAKGDSFVEATEWTNGEGWDIVFDDVIFQLSRYQLEAINQLTKVLDESNAN